MATVLTVQTKRNSAHSMNNGPLTCRQHFSLATNSDGFAFHDKLKIPFRREFPESRSLGNQPLKRCTFCFCSVHESAVVCSTHMIHLHPNLGSHTAIEARRLCGMRMSWIKMNYGIKHVIGLSWKPKKEREKIITVQISHATVTEMNLSQECHKRGSHKTMYRFFVQQLIFCFFHN